MIFKHDKQVVSNLYSYTIISNTNGKSMQFILYYYALQICISFVSALDMLS